MAVPRTWWRLSVAAMISLSGLPTQSAVAEEAPDKPGVVFVVGGVSGMDPLGMGTKLVLPMLGIPHEVRNFPWNHGVGRILKDLQDTRHMVRKAEELAEQIQKAHNENPGRPLFLIGKSAGAGLALAAAERLPAGTLERLILLSPAVAPNFDLTLALRATRREVVTFSSPNDLFWLGWGTSNFGTVDRHYGPAAGQVGFVPPVDLSEEGQALYRKVVQVRWKPDMLWIGYVGGHVGTSLPNFVGSEVAPWLKTASTGRTLENSSKDQ